MICRLNTFCFWKNFALFLLLPTFFISCDSKRVFEENKEISDVIWDANEKISFEVPITDTTTPNNLFINVRNADDYPYSNLYLFITTTFPNGKLSKDTLECILADDQGNWLGSGLGDLWDNQIPFKKNVRFPVSGKYTFEIEQAMRKDKLPLIVDVGLRIEKHK
jgi:gliding motility-associated lipoprotein GldH